MSLLLRQPGLLGLFSRAALTPGASTEDNWFVVVASRTIREVLPTLPDGVSSRALRFSTCHGWPEFLPWSVA
jgi:hypothetical protein